MKITPVDTTVDLKDILFDLLAKEKVKKFAVTFDGSGDSGQIEDVDLEDNILQKEVEGVRIPNGWQYSTEGKTRIYDDAKTIHDIVDGICYDVLEQVSSGWEINSGSYGTFTFDVKKRKVSLDFNERIEDVRTTEYEF